MRISLFFNFSFDLALLALIIFITWIICQRNKSKRSKVNYNLHHWLSVIIILLILSIMSLSYGGLQLTKENVNLPSQNSTKINLLRQEIINLKRQTSSQKQKRSKIRNQEPQTMTNNAQIKRMVSKHPVKIKLRVQVKSINAKRHTFFAQNQRQMYKITQFRNHRIKPKQSIIIQGTAIKNNHNTIILKNVNLVH